MPSTLASSTVARRTITALILPLTQTVRLMWSVVGPADKRERALKQPPNAQARKVS